MTRKRFETTIPAALALGLAVSIPLSVSAQVGPGLSSGSGEGTGTGFSSGVQNNRSGSASGVGPGPSGLGVMGEEGPRGRVDYNRLPPNFVVPFGPGVDTRFPDDTTLFPFAHDPQGGAKGVGDSLAKIQPQDMQFAKQITEPGERTLTFQRIGAVAIFSNQLSIAHEALGEAAKAVINIPDDTIRDLRLLSIIHTLDNLSESYLREGKIETLPPPTEDETAPLPKDSTADRVKVIDRAEFEWRRAAYLASKLENPTYRNEMLYRVADSEAFGSLTVMNEFPKEASATPPPPPEPAAPAASPGPAATPSETVPTPTPAPDDAAESASKPTATPSASVPEAIRRRADDLLVKAASIASTIDRPAWRDRAFVAIATSGAASRQFDRALQIARLIPQPEVRTDALIRIAELQTRSGQNAGSTTTYHEAAQAVASIPLPSPKMVLTGVLIDSLIASGRFEDARVCVSLYAERDRKMAALSAIAESQGFRGAADSAMAWIAREMPAQDQPALYRRVRYGVLMAIEQNRSRDLSNQNR